MVIRTFIKALAIVLVAWAVGMMLAATRAQAEEFSQYKVQCGQACLEGFAELYLAALVARDPSLAPLAPDVRFTENGSQLAIGDALWATATGIGANKLVFTDPASGGIAIYAAITENGMPSMFAARLKVEHREITEIETSVLRRNDGDAAMATFAQVRPIWRQTVPAGQRVGRQALMDIADSYFEGITQGRGDITPFDNQCVRFENGGQMTGRTDSEAREIQRMGCQAQFATGILKFVTTISDRRYLVVDEEQQVVMAIVMFNHKGNVDTVKMSNGETFTVSGPFRRPMSFLIFEAFKVVDGRIRQIEATVANVPYRMHPGWPAP